MEISNPIASQYVMNQGLAAQLTTQSAQLPIKSERYSAGQPPDNNKVLAPTEDEQRLRSEEDKKKEQSGIVTNNNPESEATQELILANEQNTLAKLANQQRAYQSPTSLSQQEKQFPGNSPNPIQSYLENSAISTASSGISSRIDFFI